MCSGLGLHMHQISPMPCSNCLNSYECFIGVLSEKSFSFSWTPWPLGLLCSDPRLSTQILWGSHALLRTLPARLFINTDAKRKASVASRHQYLKSIKLVVLSPPLYVAFFMHFWSFLFGSAPLLLQTFWNVCIPHCQQSGHSWWRTMRVRRSWRCSPPPSAPFCPPPAPSAPGIW